MKALSIRQPWAWLIITGEKLIENRSWHSTFTGSLVIHASQAFDPAGYQWVRRNFPRLKVPTPKKFVMGSLIGTVEMIGCDKAGARGSDILPLVLRSIRVRLQGSQAVHGPARL